MHTRPVVTTGDSVPDTGYWSAGNGRFVENESKNLGRILHGGWVKLSIQNLYPVESSEPGPLLAVLHRAGLQSKVPFIRPGMPRGPFRLVPGFRQCH